MRSLLVGGLASRAEDIATKVVTAALEDDDDLKDKMRARIGAEVDRNRIGITVQLSDPEKATA